MNRKKRAEKKEKSREEKSKKSRKKEKQKERKAIRKGKGRKETVRTVASSLERSRQSRHPIEGIGLGCLGFHEEKITNC